METARGLTDIIFSTDKKGFDRLALEIFRFQAKDNELYASFLAALQSDPSHIRSIKGIPFLPIGLFKTNPVMTTSFVPEIIFESSGTTGSGTSRHAVKDLSLYEKSFMTCFERFYGKPAGWCILALLPSFTERPHSSLAYMADKLILHSGHEFSGYYMDKYSELSKILEEINRQKQKTVLLGLTYALLDLADEMRSQKITPAPDHLLIMETGGMKGRRKEMIREEVHSLLKSAFGTDAIHSEYGMSELLSQAYSKGKGLFYPPPWMKILIRDEDDPLRVRPAGRGAVNIIDLANIYSCSFLATDDIGQLNADGSFEIMGRLDNSDLRGCNLLLN